MSYPAWSGSSINGAVTCCYRSVCVCPHLFMSHICLCLIFMFSVRWSCWDHNVVVRHIECQRNLEEKRGKALQKPPKNWWCPHYTFIAVRSFVEMVKYLFTIPVVVPKCARTFFWSAKVNRKVNRTKTQFAKNTQVPLPLPLHCGKCVYNV